MKKMAAGAFKANCLAVMDDVQAKHETIVITKHGKPVAKLVPVEPQGDDIFGFLRGKVTITGDVVSPTLSRREWGNLSDFARHARCALADYRPRQSIGQSQVSHRGCTQEWGRFGNFRHHSPRAGDTRE